MASPVCRVCLVSNIRMNILNTPLLQMYEKLTNTKLNEGTGMPSTLCYVCHRQLQKCYQFSDMALKSNKILRDLLHHADEETHVTHAIPYMQKMQDLMVTPVQQMSSDSCLYTSSTSVASVVSSNTTSAAVKEEMLVVVVKEEEIPQNEEINGDPLMFVKLDYNYELADVSRTEPISENDNKLQTNNNPDVCNKQMDIKYSLMNPLMCHAGAKSYSCHVCEKVFTKKDNLSSHLRVHSGRKPYPCNMCDKVFIGKSDWVRHLRIHTGEKPFTCNMCFKAFSDSSQLVIHLRVHTGEKPYSCNLCEKAFANSSNLTKHKLRVHTVNKPYPCRICDKAFIAKSDLKRHIRVHTG